MRYCVSLRVQTDGNQWLTVGENHYIPWNVRDLVMASSGWTVINDNMAGEADSLAPNLQKGIWELTNCRDSYIRYEVEHGIGTIKEVIEFYKGLLIDCREYPFTKVYGKIIS